MDPILIIIGIMVIGATTSSAGAVLVMTRQNVANAQARSPEKAAERILVQRNAINRRCNRPVTFPLAVNGILISKDRRITSDRRMAD